MFAQAHHLCKSIKKPRELLERNGCGAWRVPALTFLIRSCGVPPVSFEFLGLNDTLWSLPEDFSLCCSEISVLHENRYEYRAGGEEDSSRHAEEKIQDF